MIQYRKAAIEDADTLATMRGAFLLEVNNVDSEEKRIAIEDANRRYFRAALAAGEFVAWLALDGNKLVATSGLTFSAVPPSARCPDGRAAYIMNMYTIPAYRKQGIASELFQRTVEECKNRGYTKITLHATEMGKPLYLTYGFEDAHGEMVYYAE